MMASISGETILVPAVTDLESQLIAEEKRPADSLHLGTGAASEAASSARCPVRCR